MAAKHFGSFSSGPATPLLATWQASECKLLLDNRELKIAIRELIHDLLDYPEGRIAFRQKSEDLLFKIKQRQAVDPQSLDDREAVLELRDKLKMLRDRKGPSGGLMLLFGHKDLRDYVRIVWEKHASLLVRSSVEQEINPDFSDVTGLEKIRLHPPGQDGDPIAIFIRPGGTAHLGSRAGSEGAIPRLVVNNISELRTTSSSATPCPQSSAGSCPGWRTGSPGEDGTAQVARHVGVDTRNLTGVHGPAGCSGTPSTMRHLRWGLRKRPLALSK